MQSKACVFVDGENLRHSLKGLFLEERLLPAREYLPSHADWSGFFDWMVYAATDGSHRRLRAYWFVSDEIECHPFGLGRMIDVEQHDLLKGILCRHKPFRQKLHALKGHELNAEMVRLAEQLEHDQRHIESRFRRWKTIQNAIALEQRAIEFRRAGAIRYNLFEERFGQEKCVDVRLACDMLMLREIYDVAIIVSGDQDYVPAVQILKDVGKTVINVAFEQRSGQLLPGGARRLNIVTDASISVPYAKLKTFMALDQHAPANAA